MYASGAFHLYFQGCTGRTEKKISFKIWTTVQSVKTSEKCLKSGKILSSTGCLKKKFLIEMFWQENLLALGEFVVSLGTHWDNWGNIGQFWTLLKSWQFGHFLALGTFQQFRWSWALSALRDSLGNFKYFGHLGSLSTLGYSQALKPF